MEILVFTVIALVVLAIVYIPKVGRLSEDVEKLKFDVQRLQARVAEQPQPQGSKPRREPAAISATVTPHPARRRHARTPGALTPAGKAPALGDLVVERIAQERTQPAASAGLAMEEVRRPAPKPIFAPEPQHYVPQSPRVEAPRGPSLLERWVTSARTTDEWEALIGTRWLNRIGALAVILGLGFFLKYAIDENWINQTTRVLLGLAIGAGLLGLAFRMHRRGFEIFSQGLVGAGISALYLSTYASYNFYHLVPQEIALVGLAAVTVVAFLQAMYYDSLAVCLLAWAGGFITPVLLMTEHPNEPGLAAYVGLLVAGILALMVAKPKWFILQPLSLAASWGIFLLWTATQYTSGSLGLGVVFATLLWLLFHAKDVYDIRHDGAALRDAGQIVAVVNALVYFSFLFWMIYPDHHGWMALATVGIGAAYAATGLMLLRGRPLHWGVEQRYELIPITALGSATLFQFWGFDLAILWALEALAVVWIGVRWNARFTWAPAVGLYALAVSALLLDPQTWRWEPLSAFQVVLNERALAFVVLAGVAAACVPILNPLADRARRVIQLGMQYAWSGLLLFGITVETNDAFSREGYSRFMVLAILWALYSLPLAWYALRDHVQPVWTSSYVSLALAVGTALTLGAVYDPLSDFRLLLNLRAAAVAVVVAALMIHVRLINQYPKALPFAGRAVDALNYAWPLLLFVGITVEINDAFNRDGYARFMVLAMAWMLYSLPLAWYGLRNRVRPIMTSALGSLSLALGVGLTVGAAYQPIGDFTVLLNIRAAALIVLVGGMLVHLRLVRMYASALPFARQAAVAIQSAVVVLLLAFITYETNDFFRNRIVWTSGDEAVHLGYIRFLVIAAFWMLYSLPVVRYAIARRLLPILVLGMSAGLLATGLGFVVGTAYQPIGYFTPVLNMRAATMLILIGGLVTHHIWLNRNREAHPWIETVLMGLEALIVLTGFELVTAELNDIFRHMAHTGSAQVTGLAATFAEAMALAGVWTVYSLLLVWYGIRRAARTVLIAGLLSTSLVVGVAGFAGIALAPSTWLSLVLALRLGILPLVIVALFLEMQLLRSVQGGYQWITKVVVAFQGVIVLLGFELVSGETWVFFQSKIEETGSTGNLQNLQQLFLSLSWLAYASVLLAIGFWRRTRWLRLGALALLALTILKVFLYDLSFLQTGFRSVSFAVLGLILIGASFLYSRFKDVLIGDGSPITPGRPKDLPPQSRRPRSPRPPSGQPGHV